MSDINVTSDEAQRLKDQEDAIIEKSKEFLIASLRWSLALLGAKDFLINMQAAFITIVISLITLFGISSRTTRSYHGMIFINLAFLLQGFLVVGITIDSIILNSYIKWVVYVMFLAMVAINPNYQQIFQEIKQFLKSNCEATSSRIKNFIQSQVNNFANRKESSMNRNAIPQSVGGDGGGVGEDNV